MILTAILFIYMYSKSSCETVMPFNGRTPDLNALTVKYFVDKSDIIKAFFQSGTVTLVTAPRLFGKSVNMELIKRFCEVTVDEFGDPKRRESTDNYKLFASNNLNVFKDGQFFSENFAKHPVILFDFQTLNLSDAKSFAASVRHVMSKAFDEHKYLLHSSRLDGDGRNSFRSFHDENNQNEVKDEDVYNGAIVLSYLLHAHFDETKCTILIDNFDTAAVREIFSTGSTVTELLFLFLSVISKSDVNPFVNRTLINSCTPLGPTEKSDSGFITFMPFLGNHSFSSFYGFTENEVLRLHTLVYTPYEINTVRDWYGGYKQVGGRCYFYNPYSVVKYLESEKLGQYWAKTVDTKNAHKVILQRDVQKDMYSLIAYNFTRINYARTLNANHFLRLKNVFRVSKPSISGQDVDLFLQFMTHLGYFNIELGDDTILQLEIPNLEVDEFLHAATETDVRD